MCFHCTWERTHISHRRLFIVWFSFFTLYLHRDDDNFHSWRGENCSIAWFVDSMTWSENVITLGWSWGSEPPSVWIAEAKRIDVIIFSCLSATRKFSVARLKEIDAARMSLNFHAWCMHGACWRFSIDYFLSLLKCQCNRDPLVESHLQRLEKRTPLQKHSSEAVNTKIFALAFTPVTMAANEKQLFVDWHVILSALCQMLK